MEIRSDPLEDFRNKFYKKVEDEKKQKDNELKFKQKHCWHKYTRFIKYNEKLTIVVCQNCNHSMFFK